MNELRQPEPADKEGMITTDFRIGLGYDSHRLGEGGPLRLGGITIPFTHHLVGHSDADVLLHAVTDALLGALAERDIGELFPDTDPAHRGRDSAEMLHAAYELVRQGGYQIANLDCVIHAERPKLSPHKESMRRRIAAILELKPGQVGLKGKTAEQMGEVGQGQSIAAQCVVLLRPLPADSPSSPAGSP